MINPRYTSFFIIFYVVYSCYNSFYLLASLGTCVLSTSIIHHNKLIPNFRKYDWPLTFIIILYHLNIYAYLITHDYYTWLPALFYVLGASSYYLSLTTPKPNLPPTHLFYDTYHGYYHIYGLIGNLILINCIKNNNLLE
jgi:hypothetical protein